MQKPARLPLPLTKRPHRSGRNMPTRWKNLAIILPLIAPKAMPMAPAKVLEGVRHFWYDTALSAGAQVLSCLRQVADPGRILFGSDWPYGPETVTAASVETLLTGAGLSAPELRDIQMSNALALFPRLKAFACYQ